MKAKNLIYYDWHLDIRAGGPPGYLANLRYGLDRINNPEKFDLELWSQKKVTQINNLSIWEKFANQNKLFQHLYVNYLSKGKKKYYKNYIKFLNDIDNIYIQDEVLEKIKNENIKTIHCHFVVDALKVINTLKKENIKDTKVILTSHMPEAPALENYNLLKEMGYSEDKAQKFKQAWEYIQKRAFCESDILIFPSKEAMEPYYDTIPEFKDWIKNKDVRFFQTGAKQLETTKTKEELKKEYNIPNDKKVVVYIGRHIEVKGYDVLVDAGKKLLSKRQDVIFMIGGKQNVLINPPQDTNWKELGWVNPAELLKVADVFVLPNKRTYFDLILLEVMSTGTPVIASETGGNKSVQNLTKSLILYNATSDGLVNKLDAFLNLSKEETNELSKNILDAYYKYYTPEHFAQRYLDLIQEIYEM